MIILKYDEGIRQLSRGNIHEDIASGLPEEVIKYLYNINTRQLAGYKSALSKKRGTGRKSKSHIQSEDAPEIDSLILQGRNSKDIAELFGGKYSWYHVASRKGYLSRIKTTVNNILQ